MDDNNSDRSDDGILMKQESVLSLYEPTPMTPTNTKSFLSAPLPESSTNVTSTTSMMRRNVSYGNLMNQSEARVLVLYTGELYEFYLLH